MDLEDNSWTSLFECHQGRCARGSALKKHAQLRTHHPAQSQDSRAEILYITTNLLTGAGVVKSVVIFASEKDDENDCAVAHALTGQ